MLNKILNRLKIILKVLLTKRQIIKFAQKSGIAALETYIFSKSAEYYKEQPTPRMLDISLNAVKIALDIDLSDVKKRFSDEYATYLNIYPGEHYKLLAALILVLKPALVIEIGTYSGASSLVMKKYLPGNARLITYDVIPWQNIPNTGLRKSDFNEAFEQRLIDLPDVDKATPELELIKNADLIFIDAAKDGVMEKKFCELLDSVKFTKPPIVFFDDIQLLNMVKIWQEIKHPKLDLTSFGHWSGTGIVDWR